MENISYHKDNRECSNCVFFRQFINTINVFSGICLFENVLINTRRIKTGQYINENNKIHIEYQRYNLEESRFYPTVESIYICEQHCLKIKEKEDNINE